LVITFSGAQAADFQKDLDAYDARDFQTALVEFSVLAEEVNTNAQHHLANMYEFGTGIAQDYKAAAKWYKAAAEQGHMGVQIKLGWMYFYGWGGGQDYALAHMWFSVSMTMMSPEYRNVSNATTRPTGFKG